MIYLFKKLIQQSKAPSGKVGIQMMKIWNRAYLPMVNWSLGFVTLIKPKNILDIGVGNGASSNLLKNYFTASTIYGIDYSDIAIEQAKKNYSTERLKFETKNILKTEYPARSFDLIFAFQTHFHWEDLKIALVEIKRILADEGELLIACEHSKLNYYLPNLKDAERFQQYLSDLGLFLIQKEATSTWIFYRIVKENERINDNA
nr:class I SAM-dependent methyltransferase [Enterococcus malodoratus]